MDKNIVCSFFEPPCIWAICMGDDFYTRTYGLYIWAMLVNQALPGVIAVQKSSKYVETQQIQSGP